MKFKRITAIILCTAMALSSTACISSNTAPNTSSGEDVSSTTTVNTNNESSTPDETSTENSSSESANTSSGQTDGTSQDAQSQPETSETETVQDSESSASTQKPATSETSAITSATASSTTTTTKANKTTTTSTKKPTVVTTTTRGSLTTTTTTAKKPSTTTTTAKKPSTTTTTTSTTTTKVTTTTTKKQTTTSTPASTPIITSTYEAEDATLFGLEIISNNGCSGGKAVGKWENKSSYLEFVVVIPADGLYDLTFTTLGIGSTKENHVLVDGTQIGTIFSKADVFSDCTLSNNLFTKGTHKVRITSSWGWMQLDKMTVSTSEGISKSIFNVSPTLINKNSSAPTKSLFKYLCDSYGNVVISGQVCDDGLNGKEFKAIKNATGETPAMLGLDMMRYTPSRTALGDTSTAVEKAIEFSNAGGIVTFCWHWNAPTEYLKSGNDPDNNNPRWWGGFYTKNTDFDLAAVMNGNDPTGKALLDRDIKAIATQLNRLDDAGVPVLWRPLHEASGGWFWWGASGADAYKKLWIYLYDQLTNVYGCNNLIWVCNAQNADWYPGDEYVDIIGEDIYPGERVYSAQTAKFCEAAEYSTEYKIVALTENGCVFDIDNVVATGAMWAWFNTWSGEFVVSGSAYSERYTELSVLKKTYQSQYVITLDELPDLSNY